jgi:phage tail sheath gpL-like
LSTGVAQMIVNVSRMLVSTANAGNASHSAGADCSALIKADPDGPIVACTYKR